jgi:septum formation protein
MLSLLKNIDRYEIILASASPRRFELLKMIGLEFKMRPSHIQEIYRNHLSPVEYAMENARRKGMAIAEKNTKSLVISADTIVVLNGDVIEKPKDEAHAYAILKKLSGHTHQVITAFGLILKDLDRSVFDYAITEVTFRDLTLQEIKAYIDSGEPYDKAGGYGAQGPGAILIQKINGCFFNVVGFPLTKFFYTLDTFLSQI